MERMEQNDNAIMVIRFEEWICGRDLFLMGVVVRMCDCLRR